ncbi:putative 50S ribosomal protein L7Ae [Spiroplasma sabaudiense Ar-1343]|uniref:Putative 50S ribosomal protein L7Ae n=1 Tax=Spiroplasma sabaudiense Ar-1343 TaxID=1276257 RepID=W6AAE1_9MOLU|nr:ribosomal L7Ae/L30e/S12e/Gadd45 family protein [Spiroplasma sabaudiense]AHI53976.1 putative 50S ribosomal protein L7Ae [Spiroplasma sabaudiense Ar-1343]
MNKENNSKLLQTLGLVQASRSLISGNTLFELVKAGKIKLVLISSDMGESQKKKLTDKCNFYKVNVYHDLMTSQELSHAIGKDNVKAIGIKDFKNAKWVKNIIEE